MMRSTPHYLWWWHRHQPGSLPGTNPTPADTMATHAPHEQSLRSGAGELGDFDET